MKPYTVHVDIKLPRDEVILLFDSPENMFHWQNGLQDIQHLSGHLGEVGSTNRLIFQHSDQTIELTETITKRNLPDAMDGLYQWSGGKNTLKNRFIELGPNLTRWESTCEYQFKTWFMKLMGFWMPGSFKKQNQKFLDNFKAFCETGTSVLD